MRSRPRGTSRLVALTLALGTLVGVASTTAPVPAQAAGTTDSAVTVRWAGGNDPAIQQIQPDHAALTSDGAGNDAGSGHWDDFRDLEITVGQTRGLIDQVVTVTATGMDPTARKPKQVVNYLQMFQCWGDPADPEFATSCQWGGYNWQDIGGSVSTVADSFGSIEAVGRGGRAFHAVTGQVSEQVSVTIPGQGGTVVTNNGVGQFFDASTSNEQPFVPIDASGRASTTFTVQSAAAQPYLGCGDPDSRAGSRCWLVVVPIGQHSGSPEDARCGPRIASNLRGGVVVKQYGSPMAAGCTYWDNRVVVPLDFEDPYLSCPAGSTERRVAGSDLLAEAMSSWQPRLCSGQDGAAFGLTTNSGNVVRSQLLGGQVGMAAVSAALTPESIGGADPSLLDTAELGYAPLANTALTIGFVAEGADGAVHRDLRLTPRLIAKMLTQTYRGDIPQLGQTSVGDSVASRAVEAVIADPEWVALGNPTDTFVSAARAAFVVYGPQGDDATRLLWQYVLADADARAFLGGEPDPWGTTVNPYYLPPGHAGAAGGGLDLLSTPLDTFPKADQTVSPGPEEAEASHRGLQVDSTSYSPYSASVAANASRIARVDDRRIAVWDPAKFSGANVGFWVGSEPPLPASGTGRLLMGPTSSASAEHYGLAVASLALPLADRTAAATVASARQFVAYEDESVATAIAAQVDDGSGIATLDHADLPAGAYPLATTVYAAVDLASESLDESARREYASLLDYAAGPGNARTGLRGGLPEGYVPLTADQIARAGELAAALRAPRPDPDGAATPAGPGPATGTSVVTGTATAPDAGATGVAPGTQTGTSEAPALASDPTPAAVSPAGAAVGLTLLAGAGGMLASPFLLRRRGAG